MEILTPAIQHDNKNIRVYWNVSKCAVVLLVTNQKDNKRVTRKDYKPLLDKLLKNYEDVEQLKQMFTREIRGNLNAFFNLDIGMDNTEKLANALLNYNDCYNTLGRKVPAHEELAKIDNNEFAQIFQEVQKEVEEYNLEDQPKDNAKTSAKDKKQKKVTPGSAMGKIPKEVFKRYIDQFHKNELRNINDGVELPQTIVIDWQSLKQFDKTLANMIVETPKSTLDIMKKALFDIITNKEISMEDDVNIRFDNLEVTPAKHLLANKIGQMVQTEGIIKGILEPSFYYTMAVFECRGCQRLHPVTQTSKTNIVEPSLCTECNGRSFKLMPDLSTAKDLRYIRLQEPTDNLDVDERPRNILVCLTGNLTHNIVNGQKVKITGILEGTRDERTGAGKFMLDANHVVKLEDKKVEITNEDEKTILELSKNPNILDILVNSFAPKLIIDREIKLAVLCYLVNAGYTEELREQIHILIIGDPGTAKTQLKESAFKLVEKGIKTSGTNTTGVGLAGAVDKDPVLNVPIVNAGAMTMAHNGHLFIDECEKMTKEDSQKILDGMESGEIQITKWGLNETLPAQTSIFAIGNPVYGRFDPYKTINDQIKIYPPLQSRFDLIIALEDKVNETKDNAIGKSILNKFRRNNALIEDDKPRIDQEMLIKYVTYARDNYEPEPMEHEALDKFLLDYYKESREIGKDARSFEAVNRFAGAIAKLRLTNDIDVEEYQEAIDMQNYSLRTIGIDPLNADMDNVRGHINTKDKEHRNVIKTIMTNYINSAENLEDEAMPKDILKQMFVEQQNVQERTFYNAFLQLKEGNEIYEYNKRVYFKH